MGSSTKNFFENNENYKLHIIKGCKRIIVRSNVLMRFPTPDGVAATLRRVVAGQEGLYRSLFSSWMVEMKPFDRFNCQKP
jgi:hypothetical protein